MTIKIIKHKTKEDFFKAKSKQNVKKSMSNREKGRPCLGKKYNIKSKDLAAFRMWDQNSHRVKLFLSST